MGFGHDKVGLIVDQVRQAAVGITFGEPDPAILAWWSSLFEIPCVAIGGITPGNAPVLIAQGADFIAVSHAIWGASEPVEVARHFNDLLLSGR